MTPSHVVADAVVRVSVGDTTLAQTLRGVAELANAAIGGSDMVGVTMLVAGRPRTAVSTDDIVSEVEYVQYLSGIGPCLDACGDRQVQRVDSTDNDARWPAFGRVAAARGILSSMSLPLVAHHQGIGALNCYSRTSTAFSADDERVATPFALAAAMALAYWDARHAGPAPRPGPAVARHHRTGQEHSDGYSTPRPDHRFDLAPQDRRGTFVVDIFAACDN